jgi:hypothetical protein
MSVRKRVPKFTGKSITVTAKRPTSVMDAPATARANGRARARVSGEFHE